MATYPPKLENLRRKLDALDETFLATLAKRRKISEQVAAAKLAQALPVRDPKRENALLSQRLLRATELGLDRSLIRKIFKLVINDSRRLQRSRILREKKITMNPVSKVRPPQ